MYLIKSVTFNFARRIVFISMIVIGSFKDILRIVLYPPSLALRLITKPFKRRRFKRYKPTQDRRHDDGFIVVDEHKHDNYQSQIDMLARKINEALLNDEAYNKQFNRLENKVKALDSTNDYLNHDRYDTLEAKVDKILSENSKLTFKPLTKEEEHSLTIAKGEAIYDDEIREYPGEPDFHSEQKAMVKQMAEVAKRDEEDD